MKCLLPLTVSSTAKHVAVLQAHCALEVFKTLDVGGTGQLSLEDLTAGCRTLVPELTHKVSGFSSCPWHALEQLHPY
jgi:hypothetical protein